MHYKAQAGIFFYTVAAAVSIIMIFGLIGMVHKWRLGKSNPLGKEIKGLRWVTSLLKATFFETQILEYGLLPWLAHIMIFWGFIFLLLLTSFHLLLNWLIPSSFSFYRYFEVGKGNLFLALWGDFWGLIFLSGILIALLRRYILRPEKLNTLSDDSIAIWLLFAVTITGFLCEAMRLMVHPEAQDSAYSFAVNWIVPLFGQYRWTTVHITILFWIHSIISFAFLAYIPFSKFRHIFASPLDYAYVTASNPYSKKNWIKKGQGTRVSGLVEEK